MSDAVHRSSTFAATLAAALDGSPSRYHLYSWLKFGNVAVDHLLVTPGGLMIIKACSQMGDFKMSNDNYRRKAGLATWFATVGEPGIGNPTQELNNQVKKLREWFGQKGLEVPVDGVVRVRTGERGPDAI